MVLICISLTNEIDNLMFVVSLDTFCDDPVPNINVLWLVCITDFLRSSNYQDLTISVM